ncbi:MAG: peptidoglycan recognition family protein [Bryobacteraceae bacterium]
MRSQGLTALLFAALTLSSQPRTRTVSKGTFRAVGIPAGGRHTHARIRLIDPGVTPEIQGRAQWCPAPFVCPKGASPSTTTPTHLIVHHTASANTASDWPAVLRFFWELHVKGNGWADIGYNFLIDPTGTSRISVIGTYTDQPPSQSAVNKLVELLTRQARRYALDPIAQTVQAASLSPRATGRTECPGVPLDPLLPEIREAVFNNVEGCLPARQRSSSCANAEGPCLSRYGVVNTANYEHRPVARGSIAAAFGANPAPVVGGTNSQLNILIPAATEPGTSPLQLFDGATLKAERLLWVTETAPATYVAPRTT